MAFEHGFFEKSEKELVDHIAAIHDSRVGQDSAPIAEMQRRLIVAVRAASDAADKQTAEVVTLTRTLKTYTIVLVVIGVITIALMLWKG